MLGIADPEMLAAISPITHASRYPPIILFCGDEDAMMPPELSADLYRAIRAAGGVADLRLYSNLIHEFVALPGMMKTTISTAAAFFTRMVLDKPAFDAALDELGNGGRPSQQRHLPSCQRSPIRRFILAGTG
jgi:acetyl esterase/lipase